MVAEPFLFETDPISCLQANVKAFVKLPQSKRLTDTLGDSIKLCFENMVQKLGRLPIMEGKKRITWTCKCGRQLYDDFWELRPGAVEELESQLRRCNSEEEIYAGPVDAGDDSQQPADPRRIFIRLWKGIRDIFGSFKPPVLPQHNQRHGGDVEIGVCPMTSDVQGSDHNFVLLCVPFQRWATKLHQAEVCRINSDQELFQVLRHYYSAKRGSSAWMRFRKLHGIDFVMFEMYSSQLVDVQVCPSLPSDVMHTQYAYEPMPADVIPPIGSNHLMHLFEHPEDAEVIPVLYRKIPKKLRARLEACPQKGSSVGWGLKFVEGMNWFVVLIYGCVGFGLALLAAVVWATTRADIQGAFAIAGFMVAFLLFCAGIVREEIHI